MNRIIAGILFAAAALIIYFGAHFYVFFRFSQFFSIRRSLLFYFIAIFLALSFPLAMILVRYLDFSFFRGLYSLSGVWLGALFYLLISLLVYELIRIIFKTNDKIAVIILLILVLIIVTIGVINAMFIRVHELEIPIQNLNDEIKIVQISDVHLGAVHGYNYMKDIVDKTNKANPDMVLITGDLFDGSSNVPQETVDLLNDFKAKTYFTTGNHEDYYGLDKALKQINKTKVEILRNEVVKFKGIQIIGIDNPSDFARGNNSELKKIKFNNSIPSVLMFHPPEGLDDAENAGVSLQLSGHVHDGQIFPFSIFTRMFYPMIYGVYRQGNTTAYVTSGTGTWGPPLRFGTNSEIALIKLEKK